jgi:hypothetical protein
MGSAAAADLPAPGVDEASIDFIAGLAAGLDAETRQAAARASSDATAAVI